MVPRGGHRVLDHRENPLAVVPDAGGLPVHERLGVDDPSPERLADALVPQADAENGDPVLERTDRVEGDPGLVRSSRPRRNHQAGGVPERQLPHGDRVVAEHLHLGAEFADVLHQVPGERIVIVDDGDHCASSASVETPTARNRIFALLRISSHSRAGSESATIPAPAWIMASSPDITMVRMAMQKSMLPCRSKYPTAPA